MYKLEVPVLERVHRLLTTHRLEKWGFVIYRCTYTDDHAWARFMEVLDQEREALRTYQWTVEDPDDPIPGELIRTLDWSVQEDPVGLEGASKDEVRRRFRRMLADDGLMAEESENGIVTVVSRFENPRWNFCVHVDQAAMESVLRDGEDMALDSKGRRRPRYRFQGYVNLIRADDSWERPDYDRYDWASHKAPEGEDEDDLHDDLEEEIEGCRLADVGWMKVRFGSLVPSLYDALMEAHMWDPLYVRPPGVAEY